ncbi:MAG: DUF4159 domain-containing protein, partial [Chloroflexota bacterium]
ERSDNTLVVEPGIAVEPTGSFIVVTEPYTHTVRAREAGMVYLLVLFSEVPAGPRQPPGANGAGQHTRILEAYRIQQRDELPDEPCLELVRIDFDPQGGPIVPPQDPAKPGQNELDTRHRTSVGSGAPITLPSLPPTPVETIAEPAPPPVAVAPIETPVPTEPPPPPPVSPEPAPLPEPEAAPAVPTVEPPREAQPAEAGPPPFSMPVDFPSMPSMATAGPPPLAPAPPAKPALVFAVAAHGAAGADRHDDGVQYLAREVGHAAGREVDVRPAVSLADLDGVDFLYLTGDTRLALGPDEVERLRHVLDRGGVVVGEGCASGPNGDAGAREFALSFADLSSRLGRQLARVERGDRLLVARHVFSGPPAGARANMMVLESDGMIYSDADYGCAWQGGSPERPLPRGPIRDAIEFGVNLALYRQEEG